jgi:hypothetical protein
LARSIVSSSASLAVGPVDLVLEVIPVINALAPGQALRGLAFRLDPNVPHLLGILGPDEAAQVAALAEILEGSSEEELDQLMKVFSQAVAKSRM